MEPKFQTSFIPKKPASTSSSLGIETIRSTNIFSVIATVFFVITILASGGLYLYKNILTKQIGEAEQSIIQARDAFEPEKTRELIDINARIVSAKNLLDNHVIVSEIFLLMEDLVLKRMRFTDFTYQKKDGGPSLNVSGEVQGYNALAEQQNVFLQNEYIKDLKFANFNLTENGYVKVDMSITIDPKLISYKKAMELTPTN